jgi:hypothetical protein
MFRTTLAILRGEKPYIQERTDCSPEEDQDWSKHVGKI